MDALRFRPLLDAPGPRVTSLVWRVEVQATDLLPIKELVLVDAHRGGVVLHFSEIDTAKYRKIYDKREIRKITNIRSTGGVMIKTGSGQKRKVNTAAGRNRRPKSLINRGTVISVIVLASMAFWCCSAD